MKIECKFERGAMALADCPRWERREIAVAGRSNVGKSSLINALVSIKGLARTSRTPGRTQALNFFTWARTWRWSTCPDTATPKCRRQSPARLAR